MLQLWLLEERGLGAYANLTLHPAALKPLYSCLSPLPPHHVKEEASYGKVLPACLPACLLACLPAYLPACLSVSCLSVHLSVCIPVRFLVTAAC